MSEARYKEAWYVNEDGNYARRLVYAAPHCPQCGGAGVIKWREDIVETCPRCLGTGKAGKDGDPAMPQIARKYQPQ